MQSVTNTSNANYSTPQRSVAQEALQKGLLSEVEADSISSSEADSIELTSSCGSRRSYSTCGSGRTYPTWASARSYPSCGSGRTYPTCGSARTTPAQQQAERFQDSFFNDLNSNHAQARIGGTYLTKLSASATGQERKVVNTAIKAFNHMSLTQSQAAVAGATISAVAGGLTGPVGATLAQIGLRAMSNPIHSNVIGIPALIPVSLRDRAEIGDTFTAAMAEHGNHSESCGAPQIRATANRQAPLHRMRTYEAYLSSRA